MFDLDQKFKGKIVIHKFIDYLCILLSQFRYNLKLHYILSLPNSFNKHVNLSCTE